MEVPTRMNERVGERNLCPPALEILSAKDDVSLLHLQHRICRTCTVGNSTALLHQLKRGFRGPFVLLVICLLLLLKLLT